MFDAVTANLLRSAPAVEGLTSEDLPSRLTQAYVSLMTRRLQQGSAHGPDFEPEQRDDWTLERIADTYELVASIHGETEARRSAAFVAATAQQILSQAVSVDESQGTRPLIARDRVDPRLAAALLFLVAEQYSDAIDAARAIKLDALELSSVATLLAVGIRDFAIGNLSPIVDRAATRSRSIGVAETLEERSSDLLLAVLLDGIELHAAQVAGVPPTWGGERVVESAQQAFELVLRLASADSGNDYGIPGLAISYPGIRHLASLLHAAASATESAALTAIPPPVEGGQQFWNRWISHRARTAPFVWADHREAVRRGFHRPTVSATVVLPTGAGKTTIAYLKIAAALSGRRDVIFLAPTHALVEQLTADLAEAFPSTLLESAVSSDFDRLFASGTRFRRIEVMTPERCLAMLTAMPSAFDNVGLMVFDECHMLSPDSGLRRALDGMFSILAFARVCPNADFLFLSAMLRNGEEFSDWIGNLTGRSTVFVDAVWKPSRQARGVVVYRQSQLLDRLTAARSAQREADRAAGRRANSARAVAKRELYTLPMALFGLQHQWLQASDRVVSNFGLFQLASTPVHLGASLASDGIRVTPNANQVAAIVAAAAARCGLKVIVFVNNRDHAVSTARTLNEALSDLQPAPLPSGELVAIETEFGGPGSSLLFERGTAQPHTAFMLRSERVLAESLFRQVGGPSVLVATPTLAQGLNLPADMVILAGDIRSNENGRHPLEAHELLNAAARAGRAGHISNGVALLVPDPVATILDGGVPTELATRKLESIFPVDDKCVSIVDPLQIVLDRIGVGDQDDSDVQYAIHRLVAAWPEEYSDWTDTRELPRELHQSFAYFKATRRSETNTFHEAVARLLIAVEAVPGDRTDPVLMDVASHTGISLSAISSIREQLVADRGFLPSSICGWVDWILSWLSTNPRSRLELLARDSNSLLRSVGRNVRESIDTPLLTQLRPGVRAWMEGVPLRGVEVALGGNPENSAECPRARNLVLGFVPNGLPFLAAVVSRTALQVLGESSDQGSLRAVLECLPLAVRRGFDTVEKVAFAELRQGQSTRVECHEIYRTTFDPAIPVLNAESFEHALAQMQELLATSVNDDHVSSTPTN